MPAEKSPPHTSPGKKPTAPPQQLYGEKQIIIFLFSVALLLSVFLASALYTLARLQIPDLRSVAHYAPPQATLIFDRQGKVAERLFREHRLLVPLTAMHPLLPKAFVAAEDGRFYQHTGLDFLSVLRALANNLWEGKKGQGGSTITQQVARSLLLTPEKTYVRKLKEAILAWRIDSLLTKDEILYIYLNQIYLGEGAYGVEAAAQIYFDKTARQLSLAEVALLAGLPQAPSRYSPSRAPENAFARQKYVLNRMVADDYISTEEAQQAFVEKVEPRSFIQAYDPVNAYYLDVVKRQANEFLQQPLLELGARIYSCLDQQAQSAAQAAVAKGAQAAAARQGVRGRSGRQPQAALVCLEKKNGRVRALTGGLDFTESSFNRASQAKRPAGSSFKPFVYAAALSKGWQPQSLLSDSPLSLSSGSGRRWRPQNYTGQYHGQTSLALALAHSYNTATIRLLQQIGIDSVHNLARQAGIQAALPEDLSLALGTVDVSLLEITAAYGPFVNDGIYTSPMLIERIEYGPGQKLRGAGGERRRAMPAGVARQMQTMLEGVVRIGTGQRAQGLPGGISGGKTGTSDTLRDAWFIGFHDQYLAGVWVGNDQNESLGEQESGGRTAVPIWYEFMRQLMQLKLPGK